MPTVDELIARVKKDAQTLCKALGYDLNTVEFACEDGIPYAIAQPEWLATHEEVLHDQEPPQSFWQNAGGFMARNAIGLLLLVLMAQRAAGAAS